MTFLLVTFPWLFRGFFVALICLEKQCFVASSWLFRGFSVAFPWFFSWALIFGQFLRVLALEKSSDLVLPDSKGSCSAKGDSLAAAISGAAIISGAQQHWRIKSTQNHSEAWNPKALATCKAMQHRSLELEKWVYHLTEDSVLINFGDRESRTIPTKDLPYRVVFLGGMVLEFSEPKRKAKDAPPPILHSRCWSSILWGYCVDFAVWQLFLDAAFLLTVGSFLLTVELFYLQLTILASLLTILAFLLTALAFLLTVGAFLLTSGKVRLIRALRDCKQRSSTVSKKAPTASKKASPIIFTVPQVRRVEMNCPDHSGRPDFTRKVVSGSSSTLTLQSLLFWQKKRGSPRKKRGFSSLQNPWNPWKREQKRTKKQGKPQNEKSEENEKSEDSRVRALLQQRSPGVGIPATWTLLAEEPPEPKTGTARTVPSPNRNLRCVQLAGFFSNVILANSELTAF